MANIMARAEKDLLEEEEPFMGLSADIMDFLRDSGCIEAIDLGVWLFKGNSEEQLAAYLSERISNPGFPGLRLTSEFS